MSEEYEITGIIVRKKDSNDGCAGCIGAVVLLVILGAFFESCLGNGGKSVNSSNQMTDTPSSIQQPAKLNSPPIRQIRCRACGGDGKVNVSPVCPTCNGNRKVIDQERTRQNVARDIARSVRRKQGYQPKTYYKNCPFCKGRGKVRQLDNCRECSGTGVLTQR